jgi:hypothetical protein
MAHFVNVPTSALCARLEAAGFTRGVQGREVFYERRHAHESRLSVRVYTSASDGSTEARDCGDDAIRVIAQFQWRHASGEVRRKNLFKAKVLRVTSVEGVLERMINAAREGYAACNQYLKTNIRKEGHNV